MFFGCLHSVFCASRRNCKLLGSRFRAVSQSKEAVFSAAPNASPVKLALFSNRKRWIREKLLILSTFNRYFCDCDDRQLIYGDGFNSCVWDYSVHVLVFCCCFANGVSSSWSSGNGLTADCGGWLVRQDWQNQTFMFSIRSGPNEVYIFLRNRPVEFTAELKNRHVR